MHRTRGLLWSVGWVSTWVVLVLEVTLWLGLGGGLPRLAVLGDRDVRLGGRGRWLAAWGMPRQFLPFPHPLHFLRLGPERESAGQRSSPK